MTHRTLCLFSEFDGTVQIEKLKDKMGTRQLPTAELTLSGVPALLLAEKGIANIVPMLHVRSLIQIGQIYANYETLKCPHQDRERWENRQISIPR